MLRLVGRHDQVLLLAAILACIIYISGQLNDLKKELITIRTVIMVKRVMACDLAKEARE